MSIDKHLAMRERTKRFALRVLRMSQVIPHNREANIVSNQIVRSATGMAANYRAAGLARSKAEFISKLGVVLEEADETVFWLEMLAESGIIKPAKTCESYDGGKGTRSNLCRIQKNGKIISSISDDQMIG